MLVLTRKIGEVIRIGEEIQIKVVAVQGDQVRIGIEAPKSLKILREEIYQDVQAENLQATKTIGDLSLLEDLLLSEKKEKNGDKKE